MSFYSNGQNALSINENDGTGFIYYPSGRVAIAISSASSYQNSFYVFDDNSNHGSHQGSVLLAIDEKAIGYVSRSQINGSDGNKSSLVLRKERGIYTNDDGIIEYDWKWEGKGMSKGNPPKSELIITLNEYIIFKMLDRSNMSLEFRCESINKTIDTGIKVKRNDNYLTKAKRKPGGGLEPQIDRVTLKQRTLHFNNEMKSLRNKLNPKSANLSDMVQHIVKNLEDKFDGIKQEMTCTPGMGTEWKNEAVNMTLNEIPRIPLSGNETGPTVGFGDTLEYEPNGMIDLSATLPKNLTNNGKWLGDVEIRSALKEANPPMARTQVLKSASGRYSNMLVVDPKAVTLHNPTGMITAQGEPLKEVSWGEYKTSLEEMSRSGSRNGPLQIVVIGRRGDPAANAAEYISGLANIDITTNEKYNGKVELLKVEVGKDTTVLRDLCINTLPTFVMFHCGKMMYGGPMGGRKVKVGGPPARAQVLIIEPNFKNQLRMEKTLRKAGCDTFLTINIQEALERVQHFQLTSKPGMGSVFDLVLVSPLISGTDLDLLNRKLSGTIKSKRTVIAALIDVLGEQGHSNVHNANWSKNFTTTDVNVTGNNALSEICSIGIQNPVKAASIRALQAMQVVPPEDVTFGLTPESMIMKIDKMLDKIKNGATGSVNEAIGTRLSVQDVHCQGVDLTSS